MIKNDLQMLKKEKSKLQSSLTNIVKEAKNTRSLNLYLDKLKLALRTIRHNNQNVYQPKASNDENLSFNEDLNTVCEMTHDVTEDASDILSWVLLELGNYYCALNTKQWNMRSIGSAVRSSLESLSCISSFNKLVQRIWKLNIIGGFRQKLMKRRTHIRGSFTRSCGRVTKAYARGTSITFAQLELLENFEAIRAIETDIQSLSSEDATEDELKSFREYEETYVSTFSMLDNSSESTKIATRSSSKAALRKIRTSSHSMTLLT